MTRIAVCVKQVATLDDEFELRDGVLEADLEMELNEWDAVALEMALQVGEAAPDGAEVVALTVGDEEAEQALVDCLARGADRGLRIWGPELAGADVLGVAAALAAALERERPDLILCGAQSSDALNAATGVAVAGRLGMPRIAVVKQLERDPADGMVTAWRELEGGTVEVLRIGTPALLTIQTGSCRPRYANLRAIKQAREKPLETCSPAELGLDPGEIPSGARRRLLREPETGAGAQMLDGPIDQVAAAIREIVVERVGR